MLGDLVKCFPELSVDNIMVFWKTNENVSIAKKAAYVYMET